MTINLFIQIKELHKTLDREEHNKTLFSQSKIRQNAGDVAKGVHYRPYEWNGYTEATKDLPDTKMVIPREKKSSYANKFFIPGTTMRTRIEWNNPPTQK